MSIQFQRQFLLEDDADSYYTNLVNALIKYAKINERAAKMVAEKVTSQKPLTANEAITIAKAIKEVYENEGSGAGGGAGTAGANFTPGVGMQYTTKKKKVEEDAPTLAAGNADISTYTNDGFTKAKRGKGKMKSIEIKDLWEDDGDTTTYSPEDQVTAAKAEIELTESRGYSQFRKETATRTKTQQMHEAAKMINKRLEEINRLLEYASQMKSELAEGEVQFEYSHNTRSLFEKINTKVVETYTKLKKLK